jgi:small-conductance mechanosensitive channel
MAAGVRGPPATAVRRWGTKSTVHLTTVLAAPATPTPGPTPSCREAVEVCDFIVHHTGLPWLATSSYLFLYKPLRILLIVILAIVARFVIHRLINQVVRRTTDDKRSRLLRPFSTRLPESLREATAMLSERRLQRGEALGSVLRSASSATVFVVAAMLVLSELGIDLAPLLASAGIAGVAIGFGAQNLVKDLFAGLFMLLEDQYGVGDVVDVGEVTGTVEAVGLRITTIRDARGVVWYVRNGEIVRVGNKSQGWALVIVDVPVGFAGVEQATEVLRSAAVELADDPQWTDDLIEPPEVLGVEQITADGAVLRTTVKTASDAQWRVGRELRRRLTEALDQAGIAARLGAGRMFIRPAVAGEPPPAAQPGPAQTGPAQTGPDGSP